MHHTLSIYQDARGFLSVSAHHEFSPQDTSQKLLGSHEFSPRDLVLIKNFEPPPLDNSQGDFFVEDFMHVYISRMLEILMDEWRYSPQFSHVRKRENKARIIHEKLSHLNKRTWKVEESDSAHRVQYIKTRLIYTLREKNQS